MFKQGTFVACCSRNGWLESESAAGTSSAREAARRLGLPQSSARNILNGILLYPYRLKLRHEHLPADAVQREAFAMWAFSKIEQKPTWVFNILWTGEAHFSLHGNINTHNCRIWAMSNHMSTRRTHCIPQSDSVM